MRPTARARSRPGDRVRELDGSIRLWSASCERMFDFSRADATGRLAQELLSPELPTSRERIQAKLLSNGSGMARYAFASNGSGMARYAFAIATAARSYARPIGFCTTRLTAPT